MEFLSGGYYKPTIHRVVQPAGDQRGHNRLCVMYFAMPQDDIMLLPLAESPVLQRVGIERRVEDSMAPTMNAWRTARVRHVSFCTFGYITRPKNRVLGRTGPLVWQRVQHSRVWKKKLWKGSSSDITFDLNHP